MAAKSNKSKTLPIYVLNGPNLNLLGTREPGIYGHVTLAAIGKLVAARAKSHGLKAVFRQTNHEGELVDWIQDAHGKACGIVINPAAFTHTSVAVLDALLAVKMPIIEVHLSNPQSRDRFRHHSYVSRVATAVIAGLGARGYGLAVDAIADLVRAGT